MIKEKWAAELLYWKESMWHPSGTMHAVCGLHLLVLVWDEHGVRTSVCFYIFHHQEQVV